MKCSGPLIWTMLLPSVYLFAWPHLSARVWEMLPIPGVYAAAAKSLQSCPTLCYLIDRSPPGPAVPGILQARTLEWVAISSSSA